MNQHPADLILHNGKIATQDDRRSLVELCSQVPKALLAISRGMADNTLNVAYASLDTVDFSRDVLANLPHRLMVLRDRTSGWADLGSSARVLDTLGRNGIQPGWAGEGNCVFDQHDAQKQNGLRD